MIRALWVEPESTCCPWGIGTNKWRRADLGAVLETDRTIHDASPCMIDTAETYFRTDAAAVRTFLDFTVAAPTGIHDRQLIAAARWYSPDRISSDRCWLPTAMQVASGNRLCQITAALGLHPGATPDPPGVQESLVYGPFSKPFYYGGEGGIATPFTETQ
jgi:hypothetical protein